MAHGTDFLSFVLLCHLMMFRPLTFYNPNNRHHKNLMLKKSHVFSRGDVLANALESERNKGYMDQGELCSPACSCSSLRVKRRGVDKKRSWNYQRDRQRLQQGRVFCGNTGPCIWAVKLKDRLK